MRSFMDFSIVLRQLGADHVEWILRQPNPAGICVTRGAGAWTANQLDNLSAYESLRHVLERGWYLLSDGTPVRVGLKVRFVDGAFTGTDAYPSAWDREHVVTSLSPLDCGMVECGPCQIPVKRLRAIPTQEG